MSLTATRWEVVEMANLPAAGEFKHGMGKIVVRTGYYDHPTKADVSLVIIQERMTYNETNTVVRAKDVEEFFYDRIDELPRKRIKKLYRNTWIPRLYQYSSSYTWSFSVGLLVQTETQTYKKGVMYNGTENPSYEIMIEGYVLYVVTPNTYTPSAGNVSDMQANGQNPPTGATDVVSSTLLSWADGQSSRSIEHNRIANQRAQWGKISYQRHTVQEDWQKIITYDLHHDYLSGITNATGPTESPKRPLGPSSSNKLKPDPPDFEAQWIDVDHGVRFRCSGGYAKVKDPDTNLYEFYPCDSYAVFRKLKSHGTPRIPQLSEIGREGYVPYVPLDIPVEILSFTNPDGSPGEPGPSTTPPVPPDTPPPVPDDEPWTQVAEARNIHKENKHVSMFKPTEMWDKNTEAWDTYEYYAVAIIGDVSSDKSEIRTVQAEGYYDGIGVYRLGKGITIDIQRQVDWNSRRKTPTYSDCDIIGHVSSFNLPAAILADRVEYQVGIDGNTTDAFPTYPIIDARALGRAIGIRAFAQKWKKDRLELQLPAIIPSIVIGTIVKVDGLKWTAITRHGTLTAGLVVHKWRVVGYSFEASIGSDGNTTQNMSLTLEEVNSVQPT